MREYKFRAWDKLSMKYFDFEDIYHSGACSGGLGTGWDYSDAKIMQYVGISDRLKKDIYEGDIVKYETFYYGKHKVRQTIVKWEEDLEHDGFGQPYAMGYIFRGDVEIIGNIYENPELLEEGE
jgi:uncharacterized phage protein (TIGR01671 family)